jgi:hypothetical protein
MCRTRAWANVLKVMHIGSKDGVSYCPCRFVIHCLGKFDLITLDRKKTVCRWYFAILLLLAGPACAGPPYVTDDAEPTDYQHFEIYTFWDGANTNHGDSGDTGIDFNYGATPDLQLTAVVPLSYDDITPGQRLSGLGNIEIAAKYRFLHQSSTGWDVSLFPRVFLQSFSSEIGEHHDSLLLPIWVEHDWDKWTTFGGGGCEINRGGGSKDFCLFGWALTRQVLPNLQLGAEIYHQSADTKDRRASTGIGAGLRYDISDTYHVLASFGPNIQNAAETNRYIWYSALLFTF